MYRFSGNRPLTTQIQNYKVITAIASGLSCPGWLDSGIKMKEQNYKLLTNGVTCQDRSFYIWNLLSKTETKHYCVYGMKNGTTFTCGWTNIRKWNPPSGLRSASTVIFQLPVILRESFPYGLQFCIGHGKVYCHKIITVMWWNQGSTCCYSINLLLIYSSNRSLVAPQTTEKKPNVGQIILKQNVSFSASLA